jgi:hypothetical protein
LSKIASNNLAQKCNLDQNSNFLTVPNFFHLKIFIYIKNVKFCLKTIKDGYGRLGDGWDGGGTVGGRWGDGDGDGKGWDADRIGIFTVRI